MEKLKDIKTKFKGNNNNDSLCLNTQTKCLKANKMSEYQTKYPSAKQNVLVPNKTCLFLRHDSLVLRHLVWI